MIFCLLYFSLVMTTQEGGPVFGSGSGSGVGIELISEQMWEFISSEITRGILEQTLVIFGSIKEGILEILDERFGTFPTEVMDITGAHTLSFREFRA